MLQLLQSLANAALLEGVVLLWAGHGEAQVLYIYVVRVTLVRCITSVMKIYLPFWNNFLSVLSSF